MKVLHEIEKGIILRRQYYTTITETVLIRINKLKGYVHVYISFQEFDKVSFIIHMTDSLSDL